MAGAEIYHSQLQHALELYMRGWIRDSYLSVLNEAKKNLDGVVLNRRTSRLFNSLEMVSRIDPTGFSVGTNVIYGRAWELGFRIREHVRIARRMKQYIPSPKTGKPILSPYTKRVLYAQPFTVKARTYAARPWLYPAFTAKFNEINESFEQYIGKFAAHYGISMGMIFQSTLEQKSNEP